jgi:hypothetical protein
VPRTTLAAIDGDPVRALAAGAHFVGQLLPESQVSDRGLHADGQAGGRCDLLDELGHATHVVERMVRVGADAVVARPNSADRRDLGRHLFPGQHAPFAGLGALRELDLNSAHRRVANGLEQLVEREVALEIAAAEIPGANLVDDVSSVPMVRRQAALAGVVVTAGLQRSAVERLYRVRAQAAEAHGYVPSSGAGRGAGDDRSLGNGGGRCRCGARRSRLRPGRRSAGPPHRLGRAGRGASGARRRRAVALPKTAEMYDELDGLLVMRTAAQAGTNA